MTIMTMLVVLSPLSPLLNENESLVPKSTFSVLCGELDKENIAIIFYVYI